MRLRLAFALVLLCACDSSPETPEPSTEPSEQEISDEEVKQVLDYLDPLDACLTKVREKLEPCMFSAEGPKEVTLCGTTAQAQIHLCRHTHAETYIENCPRDHEPDWTAVSDYEWVDDPNTPTTYVDCPEDVYGAGWVKRMEQESLPGLCVRNDRTGEVF